jgi:hypothetical protein
MDTAGTVLTEIIFAILEAFTSGGSAPTAPPAGPVAPPGGPDNLLQLIFSFFC